MNLKYYFLFYFLFYLLFYYFVKIRGEIRITDFGEVCLMMNEKDLQTDIRGTTYFMAPVCF